MLEFLFQISFPLVSLALVLIILGGAYIVYYSRLSGCACSLEPNKWKPYKLTKKTFVTHNTSIYQFALEHPHLQLGLPIGKHISVRIRKDGKYIQRSYTPISSDQERGTFQLMVKSYENGNVSSAFGQEFQLGDFVEMSGPRGNFAYVPNTYKCIGMIAGGTGLTPMLQIIRHILSNRLVDTTKITLVFANVKEEDILLKEELDELAHQSEGQFSVHYVLDEPPAGWKGGVGHVSKEMIKAWMPSPADVIPEDSEDRQLSKVLICGPPPMISAMEKCFKDLGYPIDSMPSRPTDPVYKF